MLVHARSRPRAGAGPWSGARRPDRHRRGAVGADVRPREHRQLRSPGRRRNGIAPAGQSRRLAADADQLPRRSRQGSDRPVSVGGSRSGAHAGRLARLLAGRRGELPASAAVRRRRAGDRARAGCAIGGRVARARSTSSRSPSQDQHQLDARDDPPRQRRRRTELSLAPGPAPADRDGDRQLARRWPPATSSSPPTPGPGRPDR